MRTAVDTNVISALWSAEPRASQVALQLNQARARGGLVVCAPVYAELLAHPFATQSFVDSFLHDMGIAIDFSLSERIWREAAVAFATYAQRRRRSGGSDAKRLLVDFIVAAHALLSADQLMTLDPVRYSQDFEKLRIV